MNITATQVNELRKLTGAGMMDCKNALVESGGDTQQAIDYLRKKGQKIAAKRADRNATEGVVLSKTSADKQYGAVVMINCETDFVAKNADFVAFAQSILDLAIEKRIKTVEDLKVAQLNDRTVEETIVEKTGVIGEKIEIGAFGIVEAAFVSSYIHQGNRLATIVGLSKAFAAAEKLGHELAMQIAAMDPVAVDEKDVPADIIAREIEVGKEQAREEGKPEAMLEKIAQGKLTRFFRDNTLLNQDSILDNKKSVRQHIAEQDKDVTVTEFIRVKLG
ncbi:MAG: translation elongation factor Ts [Lentimicrobiaceae bacterium]|jgi:elongation factor Ts|nr:translation elongation factor Ts [Lentimicrobiaceae bacterium]